ncbi:unnamed protein product [Amoebophrya sp. A120]|nr:unnamed protein product [Amoebophrya sp. A120]|eukprot:GSA120T00001274001.1
MFVDQEQHGGSSSSSTAQGAANDRRRHAFKQGQYDNDTERWRRADSQLQLRKQEKAQLLAEKRAKMMSISCGPSVEHFGMMMTTNSNNPNECFGCSSSSTSANNPLFVSRSLNSNPNPHSSATGIRLGDLVLQNADCGSQDSCSFPNSQEMMNCGSNHNVLLDSTPRHGARSSFHLSTSERKARLREDRVFHVREKFRHYLAANVIAGQQFQLHHDQAGLTSNNPQNNYGGSSSSSSSSGRGNPNTSIPSGGGSGSSSGTAGAAPSSSSSTTAAAAIPPTAQLNLATIVTGLVSTFDAEFQESCIPADTYLMQSICTPPPLVGTTATSSSSSTTRHQASYLKLSEITDIADHVTQLAEPSFCGLSAAESGCNILLDDEDGMEAGGGATGMGTMNLRRELDMTDDGDVGGGGFFGGPSGAGAASNSGGSTHAAGTAEDPSLDFDRWRKYAQFLHLLCELRKRLATYSSTTTASSSSSSSSACSNDLQGKNHGGGPIVGVSGLSTSSTSSSTANNMIKNSSNGNYGTSSSSSSSTTTATTTSHEQHARNQQLKQQLIDILLRTLARSLDVKAQFEACWVCCNLVSGILSKTNLNVVGSSTIGSGLHNNFLCGNMPLLPNTLSTSSTTSCSAADQHLQQQVVQQDHGREQIPFDLHVDFTRDSNFEPLPQILVSVMHSRSALSVCLCEQLIWTMGNLVADPDVRWRDKLLHLQTVPMLHAILQQHPPTWTATGRLKVLRVLFWVLQLLCRGRPAPRLGDVSPLFSIFAEAIAHHVDLRVTLDAVSGLHHLIKGCTSSADPNDREERFQLLRHAAASCAGDNVNAQTNLDGNPVSTPLVAVVPSSSTTSSGGLLMNPGCTTATASNNNSAQLLKILCNFLRFGDRYHPRIGGVERVNEEKREQWKTHFFAEQSSKEQLEQAQRAGGDAGGGAALGGGASTVVAANNQLISTNLQQHQNATQASGASWANQLHGNIVAPPSNGAAGTTTLLNRPRITQELAHPSQDPPPPDKHRDNNFFKLDTSPSPISPVRNRYRQHRSFGSSLGRFHFSSSPIGNMSNSSLGNSNPNPMKGMLNNGPNSEDNSLCSQLDHRMSVASNHNMDQQSGSCAGSGATSSQPFIPQPSPRNLFGGLIQAIGKEQHDRNLKRKLRANNIQVMNASPMDDNSQNEKSVDQATQEQLVAEVFEEDNFDSSCSIPLHQDLHTNVSKEAMSTSSISNSNHSKEPPQLQTPPTKSSLRAKLNPPTPLVIQSTDPGTGETFEIVRSPPSLTSYDFRAAGGDHLQGGHPVFVPGGNGLRLGVGVDSQMQQSQLLQKEMNQKIINTNGTNKMLNGTKMLNVQQTRVSVRTYQQSKTHSNQVDLRASVAVCLGSMLAHGGGEFLDLCLKSAGLTSALAEAFIGIKGSKKREIARMVAIIAAGTADQCFHLCHPIVNEKGASQDFFDLVYEEISSRRSNSIVKECVRVYGNAVKTMLSATAETPQRERDQTFSRSQHQQDILPPPTTLSNAHNRSFHLDYFVRQKNFFTVVRDWFEFGGQIDDIELNCLLLDDLMLIFDLGQRLAEEEIAENSAVMQFVNPTIPTVPSFGHASSPPSQSSLTPACSPNMFAVKKMSAASRQLHLEEINRQWGTTRSSNCLVFSANEVDEHQVEQHLQPGAPGAASSSMLAAGTTNTSGCAGAVDIAMSSNIIFNQVEHITAASSSSSGSSCSGATSTASGIITAGTIDAAAAAIPGFGNGKGGTTTTTTPSGHDEASNNQVDPNNAMIFDFEPTSHSQHEQLMNNAYVLLAEEAGIEQVLRNLADRFASRKGPNEVDRKVDRLLQMYFDNTSPVDVDGFGNFAGCRTHFDFE